MKKNNFIFTILCIFQISVYFHNQLNAMSTNDIPKITIGSFSLTNASQNHPNEDTFFNFLDRNPIIIKLYAGIFDGHGGGEISELAKQKLHTIIESKLLNLSLTANCEPVNNIEEIIKSSFIQLDQEAKNIINQGCTASICLLLNNVLYLAHVGDSRMVVSKNKSLDFATTDHKPNEPTEHARILNEGGNIWCNGTIMPDGTVLEYASMIEGEKIWRLGPLGMSRSIGDYTNEDSMNIFYNRHQTCMQKLKKRYDKTAINLTTLSREHFALSNDNHIKGSCCIPDIKRIELDPSYDFIIIASDGLWDIIENEAAVEFVRDALFDGYGVEEITQRLSEIAQFWGSGDDITITIIQFDWNNEFVKTNKSKTKKSLNNKIKPKSGFSVKKPSKYVFFTY